MSGDIYEDGAADYGGWVFEGDGSITVEGVDGFPRKAYRFRGGVVFRNNYVIATIERNPGEWHRVALRCDIVPSVVGDLV